MIKRIIAWFKKQTCQHRVTESRFRWNGEWAEFYDECLVCGTELH